MCEYKKMVRQQTSSETEARQGLHDLLFSTPVMRGLVGLWQSRIDPVIPRIDA